MAGTPISRYVRLDDDLSLFVLEAGENRLPLLILHGFASSALLWREVVAALGRERRVVAYDRPGSGLSRVGERWRGDTPFAPAAQVPIALALLDALGLERVAVLGHSMGGRLAYELARAAPERVAAMILVAPAWERPSAPKLAALLGRRPIAWLGRGLLLTLGPLLFRLATSQLWAVPPADASRRAQASPLPVAGWQRWLWTQFVAMLASPPPEPAERAPQVPTLVILGTHDRVVSNDRTLALVAQWRSSGSTVRVEHFAASGHLPHLEEFERFVDTVRAFLEEDENGTTPTE